MAITSGFFNSRDRDRLYDADSMGAIFDGLITDGIYKNILNKFAVTASSGMTVAVDTGKAFFNHVWLTNDTPLMLTLPASEVVLDRIDAIVIDIDKTADVRKGDIIVKVGTPASEPERPELIKEPEHIQVAIAYVRVTNRSTAITAEDITYVVGTETPLLEGVVDYPSEEKIIDDVEERFKNTFISGNGIKEVVFAQTLPGDAASHPEILYLIWG